MSNPDFHSESRRKTPWEGIQRDSLQNFLRNNYIAEYERKHLSLSETGEIDYINSIVPDYCPFCGSALFVRKGSSPNGTLRYLCRNPECGRSFNPLTGTIFQDRKISLSEWEQYLINLVHYVSINSSSRNNKNVFTTSRYWLEKVFIVLEGIQDDILLSGDVILDETFFPLDGNSVELKADGTKKRGTSKNQMCIGVACTESLVYCSYEGLGSPSAEGTLKAFEGHIAPGSTLIHDLDPSHNLLIKQLGLVSQPYKASTLKKLPDGQNPLQGVNERHSRIKRFLRSHLGFDRKYMSNFLDLYAFASNPPIDDLEKVELFIRRAIMLRKTLKYRDFYKKGT